MSTSPSDEQQAAATSAFLAAMQQSHRQLQPEDLKQPPPPKRESDVAGLDDTGVDDQQQHQQQPPPRKAPRRSSAKQEAAASPPANSSSAATTSTDANTPAGPPYICPTCQTSYSRLEYLRRHERRHQDIRPFVCECGKGFSRSDVLSRHKRQCHYHLTGEQPSAEAVEAAAKKTRKPSMAKSRKRQANSGDADQSSVDQNPQYAQQGKSRRSSGTNRDSSSPSAHSLLTNAFPGSNQPGPPPPLLPQNSGNNNGNGAHHSSSGGPGSMSLPPPPPFYNQQQNTQQQHHQQPQQSQQQGNNLNAQDASNTTDYSRTSGFMSAIHHALNNFGPSQHSNYPPSPESSASINSRNSSPRLHYRDAIPYTQRSGSTGSSRQSSLRKGTLDPYHAPPLWDNQEGGRSSPAPGSASSSRHGSVYGGNSGNRHNSNNVNGGSGQVSSNTGQNANFSTAGNSTAAPAFSYPANEFASTAVSSTSGPHNQTLAPASDTPQSAGQTASVNAPSRNGSGSAGDSGNQRFNVSAGPLSPFSGMGLSSISPYLSAFSNARDTPLVSSPGRGIGPGTPTSSLNTNVFDYTMRPPAKPASNTTPGKPGATPSNATSDKTAPAAAVAAKRKEGSQREDPTTPSASIAMSTSESGTLPALTDFIDDQQRSAANGLLTLLGGGGAETPSRFVRGEGSGGGNSSESRQNKGNNAMDNNPGATSANPSSNPFFEYAVTPGPEAFLLRLQGGEQERRAGLLSSSGGGDNSNNASTNGTDNAGNGPPTNVLGTGLDTSGIPLGFDFGNIAYTPGATNNIGWLLSPSIQSLISSFATPSGSGDSGSYFPATNNRRNGSLLQSSPLSKEDVNETKLTDGLHLQSAAMDEIKMPKTSEDDQAAATDPPLQKTGLEHAFEDTSNPFFIPKQMFKACYSIPHWELPPLTRLSMLAMHAQQNLLKHVPILHEPTFRIETTPVCLAFAACMLGNHETGRRWWAGEEVVPLDASGGGGGGGNASAQPGDQPENLDSKIEPTEKRIDEEDGQELVKPIVMTEKMDMLMRSFATRCQHDKDKVSVVQALMLFQASNFLSSDATTRAVACISHGSVVSVARKAGLYDSEAAHVTREINYTAEDAVKNLAGDNGNLTFGYSSLPSYLASCGDDEKIWRQWCEYEGRRRTAFIILLMDTVASLDAGLPAMLDLVELKHLPLPASDAIWRSVDSAQFQAALEASSTITFGDAMKGLLCDDKATADEEKVEDEATTTGNSPDTDGFTNAKEKVEALSPALQGQQGPFARLVMLVPILRGIVHLLQGRVGLSATPSPLEAWLNIPDENASPATGENNMTGDRSVDLFKRALSRWRAAWDADVSCVHASGPAKQANKTAEDGHDGTKKESSGEKVELPALPAANAGLSDSTPAFTSKTASGATPLCEDALPFYWLCHVLLGHATSRRVSVKSSGHSKKNSLSETNGLPFGPTIKTGAAADGQAANNRKVPDFRSMLRFAKAFVNSGEGSNGSAGAWGLPLSGKAITTSLA
ncbi:unnamed protein product [Sympodiomycopsis kandeliae]